MTEPKMLIIVPTRSRPENVARVIEAWEETGAFDDGAHLLFAYDRDDPQFEAYGTELLKHEATHGENVHFAWLREWKPMVHKLDLAALTYADRENNYFAMGFAGDDHLPRTRGWAGRYLNALAEMGTGVVSCSDGYRDDQLPTQWAMTTDIVRALGRMVPAPVEHLYCDDAVWKLAEYAGCYRYLDDVMIEHMHPLNAKKNGVQWDEQYRRVNNEEQFARDSAAYEEWKVSNVIIHQVMKVQGLRRAADH